MAEKHRKTCLVDRVVPSQALDAHPASNFVILLTHTKLLAFKGLYACSAGEDDTAERVFGLGPPQVDAAMVSHIRATHPNACLDFAR